MPRVVVTAQVEDAVKWEEGFRTRGDLLKSLTVMAVCFTVTEANEFAVYCELDNLDTFMEGMGAPATAEAMDQDGVKRETVKVFELDKELEV